MTEDPPPDGPAGLVAAHLVRLAGVAGPRGVIHIAATLGRAEQIVRTLAGFEPGLLAVVLPPWDCLPYDRASPSADVMGRRARALHRLAGAAGRPVVLVTTPDAAIQKLPAPAAWLAGCRVLRPGEAIDLADLERLFRAFGYGSDGVVDVPGEVMVHGQTIDVFPAGDSEPVRIVHAEGQIAEIRRFDPVSQRSLAPLSLVEILPASELVLAEGEDRTRGIEHRLPVLLPDTVSLFDLLPAATVLLATAADSRRLAVAELIRDGYEARLVRAGDAAAAPLPPDRLYLGDQEWRQRLGRHQVIALRPPEEGEGTVPRFAAAADPGRTLSAFIEGERAAGRRVVLVGRRAADIARMAARARQEAIPPPVAGWAETAAAPAGALVGLVADLDRGFVAAAEDVVAIAEADVTGRHRAAASGGEAAAAVFDSLAALRTGDRVIHFDHGMAVLDGLDSLAAPVESDVVRLRFAGDAALMVPTADLDRVWRYGGGAEGTALDRIGGASWPKERQRLAAAIAEAARRLVALAREREARTAPALRAPPEAYQRFVARFGFTETPDQAAAIDAVLADLAAGRPMDRLVIGDVGFGKTEVALRAAAVAVLAGKQVAVVAPTTVLARQHVGTFARRFAALGVEVAHLSRLVPAEEARRVKAGLADGSIRLVVGTHALAGRGIVFADPGLVVIDEEHRFGARQKERLKRLAADRHILTLTATPIPRTLQGALVGLRGVSVLTTPPAERRPVLTTVMAFDPITVRDALRRERRRGGQSFAVCPRIEDIAPIRDQLSRLAPELALIVAHAGLPPAEMDEAIVRFADGEGDVLISTNIIESGLDVPRANTLLVIRADLFGMAQLHQLRGRVGRGRRRGIAYLLTDREKPPEAAARRRLTTIAGLDRLGAGFAISARDLDQRGAGDLFGTEQAGHARRIGAELYRHLFERAVREARGERIEPPWTPEIRGDAPGRIPESYVAEADQRLDLYARLARAADDAALAVLVGEMEDRFGPLPPPADRLVRQAELRLRSRRLGIARLDAGPAGIALSFRAERRPAEPVPGADAAGEGELAWRGERLVLGRATDEERERHALALALLDRLAGLK